MEPPFSIGGVFKLNDGTPLYWGVSSETKEVFIRRQPEDVWEKTTKEYLLGLSMEDADAVDLVWFALYTG